MLFLSGNCAYYIHLRLAASSKQPTEGKSAVKKVLIGFFSLVILCFLFVFGYMGYFFNRMGVVADGAPITRDATDRPALLVIDIQEGITGQSASGFNRNLVRQSEPFIQAVNAAIDRAQSRQIPVIYVRQENTDKIVKLITGGKFLAAGTPGTALDPRVKVVPGPVFVKHLMNTFSNPEFDAYLRDNHINHLYMTGLDAAQCVDRTIKGALKRGYTVTALTDALITNEAKKKEEILQNYQREGVALITVGQWQ